MNTRKAMLPWVGLAVTMLATPVERGVAHPLSSDVLSPSLVREAPETSPVARLEGWLSQLAVVRPGPRAAGGTSMLLFVAVAPVGHGSVGVQAVGSF